MLEFVQETHEYRLSGIIIPSVTQVLQASGLVDTSFFSEESAWRGSCTHLATALDDENDLDHATVDESIRGELEGWRKFKRDMGFVPQGIEIMRHGELHGMPFAGTPDRTGLLGVLPVTADIKTGTLRPEVAIQLAAYTILTGYTARIAVRLKKDGAFDLRNFPARTLRQDIKQFGAALSNWYWRHKNA